MRLNLSSAGETFFFLKSTVAAKRRSEGRSSRRKLQIFRIKSSVSAGRIYQMVKTLQGAAQNLPADVNHLIDQLERHCLAPDGSLVTKSAYYDLQLVNLSLSLISYDDWVSDLCFRFPQFSDSTLQAREEMSRERLRYLEAMVTLISSSYTFIYFFRDFEI